MDEIDIALTDIRIQIQAIQCRIVHSELNVIHNKLSIIEAWIRDNPPDISEDQPPAADAYVSLQPQPGLQRKKRRLY